jgi:hypothetical protein
MRLLARRSRVILSDLDCHADLCLRGELVIKQTGAGPFIADAGLVIAAPVHLLRAGRSRTAMRAP